MFGLVIIHDDTQEWDEIAYNAPYYQIVKSAGNDRNDDCELVDHYHWIDGTGIRVWATDEHGPDGGVEAMIVYRPKGMQKIYCLLGLLRMLQIILNQVM